MTVLLKSLEKKKGLRRYCGPKRIFLLVVLSVFVVWAWDASTSGAVSPQLIEAYRNQNPVDELD